ncbi:Protein kinase domain [Trypanosoma vivax]|uniref:Putative serine/threonine protein kinase n=1 Tax=Trypanosoma vivax (strain Y486) TaxID=1055687 RepID=G0UCB0_TRYVY|nr:Protein kinase domain [Trypanosoma vivax]CCC53461.1 putative serine/threonine protein kinase [Trypanosoma vivax Y486]
MSTGKIIGEQKYQIGTLIARGAFSNVYRCVDLETGEVYAVKVYNKALARSSGMCNAIVREINAMEVTPPSPHVVRLVDKLVSERNYYLVMNIVEGCTLLDFIQQQGRAGTTEELARCFFQQLLSGLHELHRSNVAHRDIKPENLLLDKSHTRLVISDFGFACYAPPGHLLRQSCGTLKYCAPELLMPKPAYSPRKVDVWAAGVTLFVMLFHQHPFQERKEGCLDSLVEAIVTATYRLPRSVSPELQHLLSVMLQPDPGRRWSVRRLLKHAWVVGRAGSQAPTQSLSSASTSVSERASGVEAHIVAMEDRILLPSSAKREKESANIFSPLQFRSCPILSSELNYSLADSNSRSCSMNNTGASIYASDSIYDGYSETGALDRSTYGLSTENEPWYPDIQSDPVTFATRQLERTESIDSPASEPKLSHNSHRQDFLLTLRVIVNFLLFCAAVAVVAALRLLLGVDFSRLPLPASTHRLMEHLLVPPHSRPAQQREVHRLRHKFPGAALRRPVAWLEDVIQKSEWRRRVFPDRHTIASQGASTRGMRAL